MEVKKAKNRVAETEKKIEIKVNTVNDSVELWTEFVPKLTPNSRVKTAVSKIAGVSIPVIQEITFTEQEFSIFKHQKWFANGIAFLKEVATITLEIEFFKRKMLLLDRARRKTTQKVNLYEKVQIPGYKDAIRKIKRFLEDEENLSKSAQKIVKKRQTKTVKIRQ
jgi:V/A-type H+-transporting ATPase subunit D